MNNVKNNSKFTIGIKAWFPREGEDGFVCGGQMTRIVLPGMKQRKKGAIVNIGSAAATVAPSGPLYAVYAGTKVRLAPCLPASDKTALYTFCLCVCDRL